VTISKTTFQDYLYCAKNVWLKLHKPELLKQFALSAFEKHLVEQGNEVESYARNLFPGGVEVVDRGERGCEETVRFMAAKVPTIFQATFIVDGFMARNDALSWNTETHCWDLYEVKGTNSTNESGNDHNHLDDLAFQASVLRRSNVAIGKYFLVHLNKEYVRLGELNIKELFLIEDKTEQINARLDLVEQQMETAKAYLNDEKEPPVGCECVYKGRSGHCTTFKYSNPDVPDYSVHDISRIGASKKKLETLIERKIYEIENVPEDLDLSDIQVNQITAHRHGKSIINLDGIREELESLVFPLYFLDYETYAPAIPTFNGYRPYQRIPFQFSLHILETPEGELSHVEYLHLEASDPSEEVAKLLSKSIGAKGMVIAWNKSFEAGVNKEIGLRLPKYKAEMERINGMLYDLMDVFKKQYYVHPEFRGSTSIKKVLPALVPELTYKDLVIHEGGQASNAWWEMISPATHADVSAGIAEHLKIYCGRDTYAMYAIWKELYKLL
jgi:hypothetical protein